MKTTLRELSISGAWGEYWNKLTSNIGTDDLNTEVSILQILNSNGISCAIWALRTQKYKDYCLFLADVAESVLHIFENEYPDDKRPRKCIDGIRLWCDGKITDDELDELRKDAYSDDYYFTTAANFAAASVKNGAISYDVDSADATYSAAITATDEFAEAAKNTAYYAGDFNAPVYNAYNSAAVVRKKRKEIEVLLRKYL